MIDFFNAVLTIFKENGALTIYSALVTLFAVFITRRYFQAIDRAEKAADMIQDERNKLLERVMGTPVITSVPDKEEAQ